MEIDAPKAPVLLHAHVERSVNINKRNTTGDVNTKKIRALINTYENSNSTQPRPSDDPASTKKKKNQSTTNIRRSNARAAAHQAALIKKEANKASHQFPASPPRQRRRSPARIMTT